MAEGQKPQKGKINIELSEELSEGIYANLAVITHSNSEFVLDFPVSKLVSLVSCQFTIFVGL